VWQCCYASRLCSVYTFGEYTLAGMTVIDNMLLDVYGKKLRLLLCPTHFPVTEKDGKIGIWQWSAPTGWRERIFLCGTWTKDYPGTRVEILNPGFHCWKSCCQDTEERNCSVSHTFIFLEGSPWTAPLSFPPIYNAIPTSSSLNLRAKNFQLLLQQCPDNTWLLLLMLFTHLLSTSWISTIIIRRRLSV
jgi:hypothetical protein